jgi:hypothetical protein
MFAIWSPSFCRFPRQFRPIGVLFAVSMSLLASPSAAQTACIRCTGPEAIYICTVTSEEPFRDKAAGLYCASKLAADRQHRSCAASREGDPCAGGVSLSFAYNAGRDDAPMTTPAADPQPAEKQAKKEPDKNGEPETLVDLTKETVDGSVNAVKKAGKATGDAIKDTGKAIGDATKKTLKCLGSALNDC